MFNGAGSVEVSARATFATAKATSGNDCRIAFCFAAFLVFSSSEMLGSAMGMNIRSPSLSGGMNSLPIPRATNSAPANSSAAIATVMTRCPSAASSAGRYSRRNPAHDRVVVLLVKRAPQ